MPEFDGFGGYDDDVDMDGQYGWGPGDPADNLEWGWGSDGFSPEHSSLNPWGGGWGAFSDPEPSYEAKPVTKPKSKRGGKTRRRSAGASKSKTEKDVTSDGTQS